MTGKLIITRHHESEWNKLGLWTGMRDRRLTEYGFKKSEEMGLLIKDIHVDQAFASIQVRSVETLSSMLEASGQFEVPTEHSKALNERDYGDYTGKNKWDMEQILGKENWDRLRREWNYPVPNGETLKMVYERAVPYFLGTILPHVTKGQNVLVVGHGNSMRALIKYIEKVSDKGIQNFEMGFGTILIYTVDEVGHMRSKEIRQVDSSVNA